MSQTTSREERRSALDEFAASTKSDIATIPVIHTPTLDLVHGAQSVAVKRDEAVILQKLKALAAAAGADWYYRFPVRDKKAGTTNFIEGASVKLANDVARLYGNVEIDCRAQDAGDSWLFHARFIDLETGFSLTRPFQQRKSGGRIGGADDERRLDIAFQIGASKAIRNVVVNALQTFCDFAFEEAREALVDKIGSDIEKWRARTIERTGRHVGINRVEAVIGRAAKDWLAPDIARVIAMMKAVNDGMATIDDLFPPAKPPAQDVENARSALDQFAASVAAGEAEAGSGSAESSGDTPLMPSPEDAAGAMGSSAPAVVSSPQQRRTAIEKMLRLAGDGDLAEDERIESIDQLWPVYQDEFAGDESGFVQELFSTAAKVARGELKTDKAKKYLQGL
jgi:hypothetical protein